MKQLILALVVFTLFQSCTKKEYAYEKKPYNNIESFVLMGYTGDSINATINDGNIIVYWAAETDKPATIKPNIIVSSNATISPASGIEVAFSAETVYTVTAEDGSKKQYHLKPVINTAIPKISLISPTTLLWISSTTVTVSGEYFLSGDSADVHVYAQRLSDGFEFDLPIDYTKLTMTSITANLPAYTNIQDTGMHKIWVKIGSKISDEKNINIRKPDINSTGMVNLIFMEAGQTLVAGDSMTLKITDNYNGNVCKWYAKQFAKLAFENYTFEASALTQTDSTIKFKLPDYPLSTTPTNVAIYYPLDPFDNPGYVSRILSRASWPIIPVQP